MVWPLLLIGGGITGAYLWGKKSGKVDAYKEVAANEPAAAKVMKAINSLVLTLAILAAIFFVVKYASKK